MPSNVVDHPIVKQEHDALMKGMLDGTTETLSASGALSLGCTLSRINTASGSTVAMTLADGTQEGQDKIVLVDAKGAGNITITPPNIRGGTAVTITAANGFTHLKWIAGKWTVFGGQAAA